MTFGLASQMFESDSGNRIMDVRAGQIFYFEDRRVSLNGQVEDAPTSDIIGQIDLWPSPHLRFSNRLVFAEDQDDDLTETDLSLNYSKNGFAANFEYFFDEDDLEQTAVSMVYPVNERWALFGKLHQSLLFEKPVENLLGLSYESCCWGIKMLYSETGKKNEDFANTERRILFEITFKGLTEAGQDIDARLYKSIPGYRPGF